MTCPNCNNPVDENAISCVFCGTSFVGDAGATTVLDQSMLGYQQPAYEQPAYEQPAYQPPVYTPPTPVQPAYMAPAIKLKTKYGLLKYILLSIITLGIYGIVQICKISGDINITASRYDGRRTMSYMTMCCLAPITLFILPLVWFNNISSRIGCELQRRGLGYKFGSGDFWLWNVLGSLIVVGPFIYCYKLFKSMNLINEHFNNFG